MTLRNADQGLRTTLLGPSTRSLRRSLSPDTGRSAATEIVRIYCHGRLAHALRVGPGFVCSGCGKPVRVVG